MFSLNHDDIDLTILLRVLIMHLTTLLCKFMLLLITHNEVVLSDTAYPVLA